MAALVVYDVTSKRSFESVARWVRDLKINAEPDIAVMLVGNKTDLCTIKPAAREVPTEAAEKYAKDNHLLFLEASGLSNVNVEPAFTELLKGTSPYPHVRNI